MHRRIRRGFSLIEVLIVIGILGLLIALLLPAVAGIRETAVVMKSQNRLRQLNLAVHHYSAVNDGKFPALDGYPKPNYEPLLGRVVHWCHGAVHQQIAPYHDELSNLNMPSSPGPIPALISPADTNPNPYEPHEYAASYGVNAFAFDGRPTVLTVSDGLSNTLSFAEHYSKCGDKLFSYSEVTADNTAIHRRATFADGGRIMNGVNHYDVHPVTTGSPPVTRPSREGVTFQVKPRWWWWYTDRERNQRLPREPQPGQCDPSVPQAHHARGLITARLDGGVQIVRPAVSPEMFWAAVTPAAGEMAVLD